MRVRGGAQLAEVIRLAQIELRQHAAIVSVGDNILRHLWIELI